MGRQEGGGRGGGGGEGGVKARIIYLFFYLKAIVIFGFCLLYLMIVAVVCWLLKVPATYSVSQGRICSDKFPCCRTEIEAADQTFYLTQSQYTDNEPTSPSADPISPGAWQSSHWSVIFLKSLV